MAKFAAGDQWTLGATKYVTTEQLWVWEKLDGVDTAGDVYLGADRCLEFEKEIWFKLGKIMWKKHCSIFQDHVKYIHNDIFKTFRVGILQYAKHFCEMQDLAKYLLPPLMKDVGFKEDSWDVRDK